MPNRTFIRELYHDLWGYYPYNFQLEEALLVLERGEGSPTIAVPTGTGKTQITVTNSLLGMYNRHFRRVVHAINRRLLVNEVLLLSLYVKRKLEEATQGPLLEIANRLRELSGVGIPLAVEQMQGGIHVGKDWLYNPAQPSIIVGTIPHLGLRLLGGAPGAGWRTARMHAGLIANDTFFVLDEADNTVAFSNTLMRVQALSAAPTQLRPPIRVTQVSATIPRTENTRVLDEGDLGRLAHRLNANKTLRLVETRNEIPEEVASQVQVLVGQGKKVICAFLNTVGNAEDTEKILRKNPDLEVILVKGSMRPLDRARLFRAYWRYLQSRSGRDRRTNDKPLVVVATQTLEMGLDITFDAVVTQAADLRALIQRLGRLNRLGDLLESIFCIVLNRSMKDPIYGDYARHTFDELRRQHRGGLLSFNAEEVLRTVPTDTSNLYLPGKVGPVLTHVDVEAILTHSFAAPERMEYLTGEHEEPAIQIIFRDDLDHLEEGLWVRATELCPPTQGETLSMHFYSLRKWLDKEVNTDSDLEGTAPVVEDWRFGSRYQIKAVLCGEKSEKNTIVPLGSVRSGSTIILPSSLGNEFLGGEPDLAEESAINWRPMIRINPHRLWGLPLSCLKGLSDEDTGEVDMGAMVRLLTRIQEEGTPEGKQYAAHLLSIPRKLLFAQDIRIDSHYVIYEGYERDDPSEQVSRVSLREHSEEVANTAYRIACALELPEWVCNVFRQAGLSHDKGKLDPRFQFVMTNGEPTPEPVAKPLKAVSGEAKSRRYQESKIPWNFRHEWVSRFIFEKEFPRPQEGTQKLLAWKLTRHLIVSHHGYFAPFPAFVQDPGILIKEYGITTKSTELDDDLMTSFAELQAEFGYWGLCYLETILRAADWVQSGKDAGK